MTRSRCPNCQHPLDPSDEICEQCGVMLTTIHPVALAQPKPHSAQPNAAPQPSCPGCGTSQRSDARFCSRCGRSFAPAQGLQPQPSTPPSSGRLAAGTLLNGKYTITHTIGAGGMGAVYLAEDRLLKRSVVIKSLIRSDDPELLRQSVQEREFLAAIKHANIVAMYDCFSIAHESYIVMEYVQGQTLDQIVAARGAPLSPAEAIQLVIDILPAFSYLAKLELVYCDVKPQNLMVERLRDGTQIVKLIDLGTVIKQSSRPDAIYGTPGFYAPEAVQHPSAETDLYSICRMLAWLVSVMDIEAPPFGMPAAERYPAFRENPALYWLLAKGTHRRPERRYTSAEELRDQLIGVLRQIAGGTPGQPITSQLFAQSGHVSTDRLAGCGVTQLDERDRAIRSLRQGDRALRMGSVTGALEAYQQAIVENPSSLDAHLRLAELLIERGELTQAAASIQRARQIDPSHWKLAWCSGRLLEAQDDLQAALNQYQALLEDLPGELPPIQALARVQARCGEHPAAVQLYTRVLRADPQNVDAILGITNSLLALKRWNEVAEVLSEVNQAAAKYIDAQLLLCDLFLHHMTPLTLQNCERAAMAIEALAGRTEDPRYFLACGDFYHAALMLARQGALPQTTTLPGVADARPIALGYAAESNYRHYLRVAQAAPNREAIVRQAFDVAPWRIW